MRCLSTGAAAIGLREGVFETPAFFATPSLFSRHLAFTGALGPAVVLEQPAVALFNVLAVQADSGNLQFLNFARLQVVFARLRKCVFLGWCLDKRLLATSFVEDL